MKQIILFLLLLLPVCAFAQLEESFDGPEINSANPWKQKTEGFFLKDGSLQFDASGRSEGKHYINVPISYSEDMEWEFDVSMTFNPSNNNHARVYVYATDKPSDVLFYVQIGHNDDNISLYSQKGTAKPEILIEGRKDVLDQDQVSVRVKLTKEADSRWILYTRPAGSNHYIAEDTAEVSLSDIRAGGFLNLACCYKASSMKGMITAFDNISVLNEVTPTNTEPEEDPDDPDTEDPLPPPTEEDLPQLIDLLPLSTSVLQFVFDKPVLYTEAVFTISGIGNAERASYADDTSCCVVNASFPAEMIPGNQYTISYKGVTDLSGQTLTDFSQEVTLEESDEGEDEDEEGGKEEEVIKPGTVLINEIMADPKGLTDLPETEYVELYNASGKTISLTDWQFAYGGKAKPLGVIELPVDGYAVLYRSGRDITVDSPGIRVPLDNFPSALSNSGKDLQLLTASGVVIDEVTYAKAKPAVSWERTAEGWMLSSDLRGGTPGTKNSASGQEPDEPDTPTLPEDPEDPENPEKPEEPEDPVDPSVPIDPIDPEEPAIMLIQPGEIIFNELLPDPASGGSEYFELYNRTDNALSLAGLAVAVRKTDGSLSTRYPLASVSRLIEPEGYALLTKSKEGVASFYLISVPEVLFELPKLLVLANTSSTLVLFRVKDEVVIDEVSYSSKWHASSIKDTKGVSLERIAPDVTTQDPANWTSASASSGYGTPGYRNSQYGVSDPGETTGIEVPVLVEGSGSYIITYRLDQPGYNCRIFIFDTSGRRAAEIADHELLGAEGRLTWDGLSLSGRRLQTGVYIFYAELYHTTGKTLKYKKVFLVQ